MSNTSDQNEVTTEPSIDLELETLKNIATLSGVQFHPNIKGPALSAKIEEHLKNKPEEAVAKTPEPVVPKKLTPQQERMKIVKEATKLIRVNVVCMNPNRKEWKGDIFTVSNSVVPTIKKYIKFNTEEGWHVPQMLLNSLREKRCQLFKTVTRNGVDIRQGYLVPEFSIEELPPLNEKQMEDLRKQQAMANGNT